MQHVPRHYSGLKLSFQLDTDRRGNLDRDPFAHERFENVAAEAYCQRAERTELADMAIEMDHESPRGRKADFGCHLVTDAAPLEQLHAVGRAPGSRFTMKRLFALAGRGQEMIDEYAIALRV